MFTHREFADGAHEFRDRIMREASRATEDRDYEIARSENELAVIKMSQDTDPSDLARILTYLPQLIDEANENSAENPATYEHCVNLSNLFTYSKLISRECELSTTLLEEAYSDIENRYVISTGGLIYMLMPRRDFKPTMPSIRVKVPITASPGKVRTITHEAFVAIVALNPLRRLIPSFSYVFSYWQCGSFLDAETTLSGMCDTAGTRPVLLYENIREAQPLSRIAEFTLPDVLNFLLQLMGALSMAHSYADYTHYDLHMGNVLFDEVKQPIAITFEEYEILSDLRVIIIDNGLAYCKYERPDSLAPLRKTKPRYSNANSIEIFDDSGEDAERLQTTRISSYGSIQNRILGVDHKRSYPLGDIFRIFFDLFGACDPTVKSQLMPLVSVFFKNPEVAVKMIHTSSRGSSLVNRVALPPFREDLYNYRYLDFAREILRAYPEVTSSFVTLHSVPLGPVILPTTRLRWHERSNPDFVPYLSDVGITALLDRRQAVALKDRVEETPEKVFGVINRVQGTLGIQTRKSAWRELDVPKRSLGVIVAPEFHNTYQANVRAMVHNVQLVRMLYSDARLLTYAFEAMGVDRPFQMVAEGLKSNPEDLRSLASYCHAKPLSEAVNAKVQNLLRVTNVVEDIIRDNPRRRITEENAPINWYRACLPAIRVHIEFCLQWGNLDASFGELSLPDVDSV